MIRHTILAVAATAVIGAASLTPASAHPHAGIDCRIGWRMQRSTQVESCRGPAKPEGAIEGASRRQANWESQRIQKPVKAGGWLLAALDKGADGESRK